MKTTFEYNKMTVQKRYYHCLILGTFLQSQYFNILNINIITSIFSYSEDIEQELEEQDALSILNLLNYDMTDIFAFLGVNTKGGEFVYVEDADMEQVKTRAELLEKAVTVFDLPLDDDYLYEQLNVEKPDNYEQLKAEMEEKKKVNNPFAQIIQPQNRSTRFFGKAPDRDGASDW